LIIKLSSIHANRMFLIKIKIKNRRLVMLKSIQRYLIIRADSNSIIIKLKIWLTLKHSSWHCRSPKYIRLTSQEMSCFTIIFFLLICSKLMRLSCFKRIEFIIWHNICSSSRRKRTLPQLRFCIVTTFSYNWVANFLLVSFNLCSFIRLSCKCRFNFIQFISILLLFLFFLPPLHFWI